MNHVDIEFLAVLATTLGVWLEQRSRREREHQENRDRMTKLETTLEPISRWFYQVLDKQQRRNGGDN